MGHHRTHSLGRSIWISQLLGGYHQPQTVERGGLDDLRNSGQQAGDTNAPDPVLSGELVLGSVVLPVSAAQCSNVTIVLTSLHGNSVVDSPAAPGVTPPGRGGSRRKTSRLAATLTWRDLLCGGPTTMLGSQHKSWRADRQSMSAHVQREACADFRRC